MKVLIAHADLFCLTHGGFQIQIEQTKLALESIGVQVEFARWWDSSHSGNIIHYFGRIPEMQIQLAHDKGIKVVMSDLMSDLGARRPVARAMQRVLMQFVRKTVPAGLRGRLAWESFRRADACIALTEWEGYLMRTCFGAPPERVHCVPNGVEAAFLQPIEAPRGPWLVCTATIRDLKRVLELAQAAVIAKTPVWIIGKPYSEHDPYALAFYSFAKRNATWVRYEGAVEDRSKLAAIYREARGFVLLSRNEALSLSALEAAACGCPLLLTDLPWARCVFKNRACYCPITSVAETAKILRRFADKAPNIKRPPKPLSWTQVAELLKAVYEKVLSVAD